MSETKKPNLILMAVFIEGFMAVFAIALAWFGLFDSDQPLNSIDGKVLTTAIVWGALGLLPMLVYLAWFHFYPTRLLRPMKDFVEKEVRPLFRGCSLGELAVLSILAGLCEELLFRWCLQGGIESVLPTGTFYTALAVFTASLIFGLCHWVNASYGISTFVIGLYLGWMMVASGSWIGPAITHALFDFVALLYIARYPSSQIDEPVRQDSVDSDIENTENGVKRP